MAVNQLDRRIEPCTTWRRTPGSSSFGIRLFGPSLFTLHSNPELSRSRHRGLLATGMRVGPFLSSLRMTTGVHVYEVGLLPEFWKAAYTTHKHYSGSTALLGNRRSPDHHLAYTWGCIWDVARETGNGRLRAFSNHMYNHIPPHVSSLHFNHLRAPFTPENQPLPFANSFHIDPFNPLMYFCNPSFPILQPLLSHSVLKPSVLIMPDLQASSLMSMASHEFKKAVIKPTRQDIYTKQEHVIANFDSIRIFDIYF